MVKNSSPLNKSAIFNTSSKERLAQAEVRSQTGIWLHTLGARGFSCAVSGFGQVLKSGFPARVFCQRPKTCRPEADEAPRHTR